MKEREDSEGNVIHLINATKTLVTEWLATFFHHCNIYSKALQVLPRLKTSQIAIKLMTNVQGVTWALWNVSADSLIETILCLKRLHCNTNAIEISSSSAMYTFGAIGDGTIIQTQFKWQGKINQPIWPGYCAINDKGFKKNRSDGRHGHSNVSTGKLTQRVCLFWWTKMSHYTTCFRVN